MTIDLTTLDLSNLMMLVGIVVAAWYTVKRNAWSISQITEDLKKHYMSREDCLKSHMVRDQDVSTRLTTIEAHSRHQTEALQRIWDGLLAKQNVSNPPPYPSYKEKADAGIDTDTSDD